MKKLAFVIACAPPGSWVPSSAGRHVVSLVKARGPGAPGKVDISAVKLP